MQYFTINDFILLKNLTLYLRKLIKQWRELFIIISFGENYSASYILKTLDRELISKIYYNDYLYIFCPQGEYLHLVDKEPLVITRNFFFKKKRD